MKKLALCLVFILGTIHSAFCQLLGGYGYNYSRPIGPMATNIERIHSFNPSLFFPIPETTWQIGLEGSWGRYAKQKTQQEYTFPNDPTMITNVNVNVFNQVNSIFLTSQFEFVKQGKIKPYVNLSIGRMWFKTELRIDDIDETDDCEPLYTETLLLDGSTVGKMGLGFRIDLPYSEKSSWYVDFGVFYMAGMRNVRYMSTYAPTPQQHHNPQPTSTQLIEMDFINTQTQIVHKHHVGYVYESPIKLLDFRVRAVFPLIEGGNEANERNKPNKRHYQVKRKNPFKNKKNYQKFRRFKR
jgi:hypothetical protein